MDCIGRERIFKVKNQGKNIYRLAENPLEKKFAEAWDEMNDLSRQGSLGTLNWLLAEDPNWPKDEVTHRDRMVAATVIQWLGSHVGQYFLEQVLKS